MSFYLVMIILGRGSLDLTTNLQTLNLSNNQGAGSSNMALTVIPHAAAMSNFA